MNVLAIGASKNIGYYASLRLLDAGCNITFMLRFPSTFDSDEKIQSYVRSNKAHIVKGDALVLSDVKHAWDEALTYGVVDVILFTVGGKPSFKVSKGFVSDPANLVTQSILNLLCTMSAQSPYPKLVAVTSMGCTHSSHATLPLPLKPLYNYALAAPHKDKVGAERVIAHCAGWSWDVKHDGEPKDDIMGERWMEREGLPAAGTLRSVLVLRPALLTDGECKADIADEGKAAYRVKAEHFGGWTVSRKDVAHFVADAVLNRWNEFENKGVSIAY